MNEKWLTAEELSKLLRTSRSTIYRLARAKKLESKSIGNKLYFRYDAAMQTEATSGSVRIKFLAGIDQIVEKYHAHPWFVSIAGLSSILGLLLGLLAIISPNLFKQQSPITSNTRRAGVQPFRVSYLRVGGQALDVLANGEISAEWETALGGQPFIVPNSVFKKMTFLVQNFSEPLFWDDIALFKSMTDSKGVNYLKEDTPKLGTALEKFNGKHFFVGSLAGSYFYPFPTFVIDRTELVSLLEEIKLNSRWLLEFPFDWLDLEDSSTGFFNNLESGFIDAGQLYFKRYATDIDVQRFRRGETRDRIAYSVGRRKQFNFYTYVIQNQLPSDFFTLSLQYYGCGGSVALELGWYPLFLEVVVIENTSSGTIDVGKFTIKENGLLQLRKRKEDEKLLTEQKQQGVMYYTQRLLKPGEKILVPLRLVFRSDRPDLSEDTKSKRAESRMKVLDRLKTMDNNRTIRVLNTIDQKKIFELTVSDLIVILGRDREALDTNKEFVYGPSMSVESIEIDGEIVPVRKFDPSRFVLQSSVAKGSCPFIYTYSAKSKEWINQGHILYGRNTKDKEGKDEIELTQFSGKLSIRENDPETSFVDFLYVRVTMDDGTVNTFLPKHPALRALDGRYLVLRQGQQVEVEFEVPPNIPRGKFSVVAHGYYVPYVGDWAGF